MGQAVEHERLPPPPLPSAPECGSRARKRCQILCGLSASRATADLLDGFCGGGGALEGSSVAHLSLLSLPPAHGLPGSHPQLLMRSSHTMLYRPGSLGADFGLGGAAGGGGEGASAALPFPVPGEQLPLHDLSLGQGLAPLHSGAFGERRPVPATCLVPSARLRFFLFFSFFRLRGCV